MQQALVMAASKPFLGVGKFWVAFWTMLLLASTYFVLESLAYVVYAASDPDTGPLTPRILSIYVHGALAIPLLFVAPLQFHPGFRRRYPQAHRWTGRVFLITSILTAALAIVLALGYEFVGSRPALVIFGLLWIFFSACAWFCARRGDFAAHRAFMIRSVAVGFAFVWIRLSRVSQDWLFPFIEDAEMRSTVREYVCFIVPLLAVEIWLTYWPALKRAASQRAQRREATQNIRLSSDAPG